MLLLLIQIIKSVQLTTGPINAVYRYMLCCDQPVHTPLRCAVEVTTKDTRHTPICVLKQSTPKCYLLFHCFITGVFKKKKRETERRRRRRRKEEKKDKTPVHPFVCM